MCILAQRWPSEIECTPRVSQGGRSLSLTYVSSSAEEIDVRVTQPSVHFETT